MSERLIIQRFFKDGENFSLLNCFFEISNATVLLGSFLIADGHLQFFFKLSFIVNSGKYEFFVKSGKYEFFVKSGKYEFFLS